MSIIFQLITVLLEGTISFFSPCVIPLLPIYMGYLAGSAKHKDENGKIIYKRKEVFIHTVFFILGISMSFFILGISFSAVGSFFKGNRAILAQVGGIIIVLLGLFQLKILKLKFLQKERKLKVEINPQKMTPFMAFIMGFLFSFAWTPCVGPALSSVLIMAGSAESMMLGNLLVLIYAVGFILPFLLLGLFTGEVLNFLKQRQGILERVVQVGGVLLIIVGSYIFISNFNFEKTNKLEDCGVNEQTGLASCGNELSKPSKTKKEHQVVSFERKDINNQKYNWQDYKDKTVILHFWATTCRACKKELNDIEKLYKYYKENKEDVILLTVVSPKLEEKSKKEITKFIEKGKYSFPVLVDEAGELFSEFEVFSYPNTFIINSSVLKRTIPGASTFEKLTEIVENTRKKES